MGARGEKNAGMEAATIKFSGAVTYIPDTHTPIEAFRIETDGKLSPIERTPKGFVFAPGEIIEVHNRYWKIRLQPHAEFVTKHVVLHYLEHPYIGEEGMLPEDILLGHQGLPSVSLRDIGTFALVRK